MRADSNCKHNNSVVAQISSQIDLNQPKKLPETSIPPSSVIASCIPIEDAKFNPLLLERNHMGIPWVVPNNVKKVFDFPNACEFFNHNNHSTILFTMGGVMPNRNEIKHVCHVETQSTLLLGQSVVPRVVPTDLLLPGRHQFEGTILSTEIQ